MKILRLAACLATLGASEVVIFAGKVASDAFITEVDNVDAHNQQQAMNKLYNDLYFKYGQETARETMKKMGYEA